MTTVEYRYDKTPTWNKVHAERMAAAAQDAADTGHGAHELAVPDETAVTYAPGAAAAVPEEKISGDVVLKAIRVCLGYFAVWPSEEALNAATLYVAASHAREMQDGWLLPVWQYAPRFFITSSQHGSGKSQMARMMGYLVPDGTTLVEPTKASLISLIAKARTVVVTEADVLFGTKRNQGILAIANASYEPDRRHSHKFGGKDVEVPTFQFMILDGLDTMITSTGVELRTLLSRCITVHARRGPRGYRPPRFDDAAREQFKAVRELCAQWIAQEVRGGLRQYVPELPDGVGNRAAALWEPPCAVAQKAGHDWPELAATACARLEDATGTDAQEAVEQARQSSTLAAWARAQGREWEGEDLS